MDTYVVLVYYTFFVDYSVFTVASSVESWWFFNLGINFNSYYVNCEGVGGSVNYLQGFLL